MFDMGRPLRHLFLRDLDNFLAEPKSSVKTVMFPKLLLARGFHAAPVSKLRNA